MKHICVYILVATKELPPDVHSLQHQTQRCCRLVGRQLYMPKLNGTPRSKCVKACTYSIFPCGAEDPVAPKTLKVITFLAFLAVYYPTFILSHLVGLCCSQGSSHYNSEMHTSIHSYKLITCSFYRSWL